MSKEFQNKLYNQEITPPPGAWEKVAAALDESMLSAAFPAFIRQYEEAPPADAWGKIATALDEMAEPVTFPAAVYHYEVTPPAAVWDKITSGLEADSETKKPAGNIFYPLLRYAAAAAVIAAVAFAAISVFDKEPAVEPISAETNQPASTEQTPPEKITTTPNNPAVVVTQEQIDDAALEASKHLYASLDATDRQRIKRVSEEYFLSPLTPVSLVSEPSPHHTYRDMLCEEINNPLYNADYTEPEMADRYITLLTPEGNFIRISKKLAPLVCCVAGEELNEDCDLQLKKWREKLAQPAAGNAAGSFLDLLNLVHSFKENHP